MKLSIPKPAIVLIIISFYFLLGWLYPQTSILAEGELFDEDLTFQANLFNKILFGGAIGFLLIYVSFLLWKKNNKYGDNLAFTGDGKMFGTEWWHKYDTLQRTIISIVFLGLVFLIGTFAKIGTLTGLRVLPQQFTPVKSLIFSTLMIPISENMMASFVIASTILIIAMIGLRFNLDSKDYKWYALIIVGLVLGGMAILWHKTAYSGSDYAFGVVFIFWLIGGMLSYYLEDAIPFLIAHMFNNFFLDFTRLFTSDTALITVAIVIFGIPILVWLAFYGFKFKGSGG